MSILAISIGSIAVVTGMAIVLLSLAVSRTDRASSVASGAALASIGALLFWLGLDPDRMFEFPVGLPEEQAGVFLFGLIMSLFAARGIMSIRAGMKTLRAKSLTTLQARRGVFSFIVGIALRTWVVVLVVVFASNMGK